MVQNHENQIRNKEVIKFEISHIFGKRFLTSPYEYSIDEVMSDPHNLSHISVKISILDRCWKKYIPVLQYDRIDVISHLFLVDMTGLM